MASCVEEVVTDLEENLCQLLFCNIGMVYVTMCDKVKVMVFHQGSPNKVRNTQLLTVLLQRLVKLLPAEFICKVRNQHNYLDHLFPLTAHIGVFGDQHKNLITVYCA